MTTANLRAVSLRVLSDAVPTARLRSESVRIVGMPSGVSARLRNEDARIVAAFVAYAQIRQASIRVVTDWSPLANDKQIVTIN
jgi:hypothetical protein